MIRFSFDLNDLLINGEKMEFGKDYFFNIGRVNRTAGNRNAYSSISREFGQTTAFQILELVDKVPTPAEKREAEEAFNGRYASFLAEECRKISNLTPALWKKTYESFGRLDEALLEKALALSKEAAKAKTFSEKESIVRSFQKMDELLRTAQKKAILRPKKLFEYNIHQDPPGISGNLVEFRMMYDAFVLDAVADAVCVVTANASIIAPNVTIADDSGNSAATIKGTGYDKIFYTVDGTDPRSSGTAVEANANVTINSTVYPTVTTIRAIAYNANATVQYGREQELKIH